jgi:hypothetical protein
VRDGVEDQQRAQRWRAEADQTVAALRAGLLTAADSGATEALAGLRQAAESLEAQRPALPATEAAAHALAALQEQAARVEQRLAWLEQAAAAATAPGSASEPAPPAAPAPEPGPTPAAAAVAVDPAAAPPAAESDPDAVAAPVAKADNRQLPAAAALAAWEALPDVTDEALALRLNQRFELWQRRKATPAAEVVATAPRRREPAPAPPPLGAEQRRQLEALLTQGEEALAAGQLGLMQEQLTALDAALEALPSVPLPDALRARRQALQAERARLEDWQLWGGGRAADDLVGEAEALALSTQLPSEPEAAARPSLPPQELRAAIQALRQRWKDLERLGAAPGRSLWRRFDAALQTAYLPVAAQQAALKSAREDNQRQREQLLDALDAVALQAAAAPDSGTPEDAATTSAAPADTSDAKADASRHESPAPEAVTPWKDALQALDRFKLAWRQLGPLEHTVPQAARGALERRLRASLERIETPLQEARRQAESERESYIASAEALLAEYRRNPQLRDLGQRVRELQGRWQQHARALPLARASETALWARFKNATDALFAEREAASSAREAEWQAQRAAREALLQGLSTLAADASLAEVRRVLAATDKAWREAPEPPRATAAALEARYRDAREVAVRRLEAADRQRWHDQCDAALARIALCEDVEFAGRIDEEAAQRWAGLGPLPAAWEQALAQRWARTAEPGPLSEPAFDDLLTRVEAGLELPTPPEWQEARRQLKLRAMKDALEGRGASALRGPDQQAEALAAVLRQAHATVAQQARVRALFEGLRLRPAPALEARGRRE